MAPQLAPTGSSMTGTVYCCKQVHIRRLVCSSGPSLSTHQDQVDERLQSHTEADRLGSKRHSRYLSQIGPTDWRDTNRVKGHPETGKGDDAVGSGSVIDWQRAESPNHHDAGKTTQGADQHQGPAANPFDEENRRHDTGEEDDIGDQCSGEGIGDTSLQKEIAEIAFDIQDQALSRFVTRRKLTSSNRKSRPRPPGPVTNGVM